MHPRLEQIKNSKFWQWVEHREADHIFRMQSLGLDKAVWKWSYHPSKKVPFRRPPYKSY